MEQQRSKEWFEQRKGRVTGSRIGAILGLSQWMKPKDVMRAMVREYHGAESEFTGNIATNYGTANEGGAIVDFEMTTGLNVVETGFHKIDDWLGASPDGLIGDDAVIEVKCPFGKRDTADFLSYTEQPHYYAQMQLEMYVTGRKLCHFYQWSPVGDMHETVDFSQTWIDENLPKAREFYDQYLIEIKSPDKHLTDLVQTKEAQSLADEYAEAKAQLESATERLNTAKKALIDAAGGKKSNISGYLVYKTERKGSIAYAKAVKDLMPDADLSAYVGKPSEYWTIK